MLHHLGNYCNWQLIDMLKQYMSDFVLCSVCCSQHPTLREYTYFSPVHHTCSCLHYFLTSGSTLADISDTQIHSINNHALVPVCLIKKHHLPARSWTLNTSKIQISLCTYLIENGHYLEKLTTCQEEAAKAVIHIKK